MWEFENPTRIIAGPLTRLAEIVAHRPVLLVTTAGTTRRGVSARIREILTPREVTVIDTVESNPSLDFLEKQAARWQGKFCGTVVAVGGGSALDTGKVLSFLLGRGAENFSLREHFSRGQPLPVVQALPVVAIPTTAGTGSEVTPFATVWDFSKPLKYSLATPQLRPAVALLDPELTLPLARDITIATGMDAVSQAFEAIWNRRANPVATSLAIGALRLALPTLPRLVNDLQNTDLRRCMLEASLLGGLAISHTRTALAHSMSYPLTAHYQLPHGLACSFTLPAILAFNAVVDEGSLAAAARAIGGTTVAGLGECLVSLIDGVGMNGLLRSGGINRDRVRRVIPEMIHPGRSDNNLRSASLANIEEILQDTSAYLPALR